MSERSNMLEQYSALKLKLKLDSKQVVYDNVSRFVEFRTLFFKFLLSFVGKVLILLCLLCSVVKLCYDIMVLLEELGRV